MIDKSQVDQPAGIDFQNPSAPVTAVTITPSSNPPEPAKITQVPQKGVVSLADFSQRLKNIETFRLASGGLLMLVAIGLIAWMLWLAMVHAVDFCKEPPGSDLELYAELIRLAAHSIVSLAAVWFGYQLFRAGERLLIPLDLVRNDPTALLGTRTPIKEMESTLKSMAEILKGLK